MRVSPRIGVAEVRPLPESNQGQIRMHICGTTYRMEPDEAVALATALADAVGELNNHHKGEQQS